MHKYHIVSKIARGFIEMVKLPIILAAVFISLSTTAANAQKPNRPPAAEAGIDKQCLKAQNKRGCTCAIETGGTMVNGRWTYYNARTYGDCMTAKGWL